MIALAVVIVTSEDLQRALLGAFGIESAQIGRMAPELSGLHGYVNTEKVSIGENIGKKIILVDFWTYSCVNCIRTLPYLRAWQTRYADKGLLIIGVHTPEFEFEKNYENVKQAAEKNGLYYPVVLDNDYATWRAYHNHYWPAKYLIDKNGKIVYTHFGEGGYEETEGRIRGLLEDLNGNEIGPDKSAPQGTETINYQGIQTPEIYFGYNFRRAPLGNQPVIMEIGGEHDFKLPAAFESNKPYLEGKWIDAGDSLELSSPGGRVILVYTAKDVNLVAGSSGGGKIEAFIDGKSAGSTDVSGHEMYRVARGESYGQHRLELRISGKNVRIYAFTFG